MSERERLLTRMAALLQEMREVLHDLNNTPCNCVEKDTEEGGCSSSEE